MKGEEYTLTTLKHNPGIFYEAIGELRTSEISWNMIAYVDLSDALKVTQNLHQLLDLAFKQCSFLTTVCKVKCVKQLDKIAARLGNMEHYQDNIGKILGNSRRRRAPLEFIGQISKVLFGTMTAEDALNINTAIIHIENKTNDLATLIMNQTMATRSHFGELYNATSRLKAQLDKLNQHVQKEINNLKHEFVQNQVYTYFNEIFETLERAMLEHELDLNILIDGILFGKQGIIHPRLISPQHLVKNAKLIKERVPNAEFPVQITEEGIDHLVKISSLHVAFIKNKLIYSLHIPLLTSGKFKLYKPTILPAKQSFDTTKYAVIKPSAEYVGVDEDSDSFYEFYEGELRECVQSTQKFICPAIFPLRKIRQTESCNIELLLNKNIKTNYCHISIYEVRDTYWKVLTLLGTWIYTTTDKEIIRIECSKINKQITIEGSGIISIKQGCKIRARTATMNHPSVYTTKHLHHYTPINNLSIQELFTPIQLKYNVNLTEAAEEIWTSNFSNVEATFNDIINKAKEIKERRLQTRAITIYNTAAYGISILGTLILLGIIMCKSTRVPALLRNVCNQRKSTTPPQPQVRNKNPGPDIASNQSVETEPVANITVSDNS